MESVHKLIWLNSFKCRKLTQLATLLLSIFSTELWRFYKNACYNIYAHFFLQKKNAAAERGATDRKPVNVPPTAAVRRSMTHAQRRGTERKLHRNYLLFASVYTVYLRQGHLITGYFRKRIFIKCKYINNLCVTAVSHVYLWNKLNEKL